MPTTLPALHSQLVLRDGEDREWRSRLEAMDAGQLTLARPFDLPIDGGPKTGTTLELTWTSDSGAYTVPARLIAMHREGRVALWVVRPEGEPQRAQRRAHFRLALDGQAKVELAAGEHGVLVLTAHLVDVSEAAIRLRVPPETRARFAPGTGLGVSFGVRSDQFEFTGAVLRTWSSRRASGAAATDVVVMLDLDEAQARDLRRALMAEQVRRRRLGRD